MKKKLSSKPTWVSASDVGRAAFCPHSLELKNAGARVSEDAIKRRQRGDQLHDEHNQKVVEDSRCYIASYLYGVNDERTNRLRRFRDTVLIPHRSGRFLIDLYYLISPRLVSLAKKSKFVERAIAGVVNQIITRLIKE